MIRAEAVASRLPQREQRSVDFLVVGGGVAGCCAAIAAARRGLRTILVQDRPVLGGNASSEVRLWILGATCHLGTSHRWIREGGIVDELLCENLWRNPEGNSLIFDTILLEWVDREPLIELLLDTAVYETLKDPADDNRIAGARAFCSQNSTGYDLHATQFCDASGDGILAFGAGAAFRMGAESREEFGEVFAPDGEFGHLLGHSLYFYTKDLGKSVRYMPPAFALKDIEGCIPRWRRLSPELNGCQLWWIEWGGRLDTVHDSQHIKRELWRVVYGVWDHIKNSGRFPEADSLTLEWVGTIPGKRESRRFEGLHMLTQDEVLHRRRKPDAVAYGGWSIDLHPADGVYAERDGSVHVHGIGAYDIPYGCYVSRNISNLFLAGRIISASHVAFGSTRVIATCAVGAEAVGIAAARCHQLGCAGAELNTPTQLKALQAEIMSAGGYLPGHRLEPDLAHQAQLQASSTWRIDEFSDTGPLLPLTTAVGQMLPIPRGAVPRVTVRVDVSAATDLSLSLRHAASDEHHAPVVELWSQTHRLAPGINQELQFDTDCQLEHDSYLLFALEANPNVSIHTSLDRGTGLLRVDARKDRDHRDQGGDRYPLWLPQRRPDGHNLALRCDPPLPCYHANALSDGVTRPTTATHAWVCDPGDHSPWLEARWPQAVLVTTVELRLDVDFDHPMESALIQQPERVAPFCPYDCVLLDAHGEELARAEQCHQHRIELKPSTPIRVDLIRIQLRGRHDARIPPGLFALRVR
ncbi:MAG: FAD-dependent oxidoreductase [Planctomycetota bacterium]|nr:FAD-dependent oxidoreductase [Planctomycetota bacterium]